MWMPSLFAMPMPILAAALSWMVLFPPPAPSRIVYQHPYFLSEPVDSRDEAVWHEVFAARPGDVIYRWVEYCLNEPIHGEVHQSWVGEIVYPMPVRSTVGQIGCHKRTFKMVVPSLPPGKYAYHLSAKYQVNFFHHAEVSYEPIELVIL